MAFRSGIDSQVGLAQETTWATGATPDHFYEVVSESLKNNIDRIESKGLRKSNFVLRTDRWAPGKQSVGGDIQLEVKNKGAGLYFYNMLGAKASTADGAGFKQTFTPGDTHGLGLTVQVGRPDLGGTVQPFTYAGCKVGSWELSNTIDDMLNLKATFDGASETTVTALASASYPATTENFYFTAGSISVAGSSFDVMNWSLQGANAIKSDRYYISATTPAQKREQERNGYADYTGSLVADFNGLTAYNRFVNGTTATVILTYSTVTTYDTAKPFKIVITLQNVRFDGETPNVNGMDILQQSLPFKVLYDGTNPAVQIDYFGTDQNP